MIRTEIIYAQVIDDPSSGVYNGSDIVTDNGNSRQRIPGEIYVRMQDPRTNKPSEGYILPLFPNSVQIPLNGEIVICCKLPHGNSTSKYGDKRWYYISNINMHGARNLNQLPFMFDTAPKQSVLGSINVNKQVQLPEQNSFLEKTVPNLQPYEGDIIINDRFGSSIRFTSGVDNNVRTKDGVKLYEQDATWSGPVSDPLMILTAGINSGQPGNFYTVENVDTDASSIIMSTTHKINITPAQKNIGLGITPLANYNRPQVLINSDRIVLNSRTDEVIISAKNTVSIATTNWASDMDKFFSMVEDIQAQLSTLTEQVQLLTTQVNTHATVTNTFSVAAAAIPLLTAAFTPAVVTTSGVISSTSSILTRLVKVKTDLAKIDSTLASLKQ